MVQGRRSMTPHSTATLSIFESTLMTLFVVFAFRCARAPLSCWMSSFVMASSLFLPSLGSRCRRRTRSFVAMVLAFCRSARAYPLMNLGANSFRVCTHVLKPDGAERAGCGHIIGAEDHASSASLRSPEAGDQHTLLHEQLHRRHGQLGVRSEFAGGEFSLLEHLDNL